MKKINFKVTKSVELGKWSTPAFRREALALVGKEAITLPNNYSANK